jgi:hypothetical protein
MVPILKPFQPLRRYRWLDTVLTRVEFNDALLEQWRWRPSGRAIIEFAVGVAWGLWTIISASWVPVGLAVALVVVLALRISRRVKEALSQFSATATAQPAEPKIIEATIGKSKSEGGINAFAANLDRLGRSLANGPTATDTLMDTLRNDLTKLIGRVEAVETALKPKPPTLLTASVDAKDRFEEIEAKLDEISGMIAGDRRLWQQKYDRLVRSLRARDVEAILKKEDPIVLGLGQKLLDADHTIYNNDEDWERGYNEWRKAVARIDELTAAWLEDHQAFLEIRGSDYQRAAEKVAPTHIVAMTNANDVRYKNVAIAHGRYRHERDDLFRYFSAKAGGLPD